MVKSLHFILSVMGGLRTFFSTGVSFDYFPLYKGRNWKYPINKKGVILLNNRLNNLEFF